MITYRGIREDGKVQVWARPDGLVPPYMLSPYRASSLVRTDKPGRSLKLLRSPSPYRLRPSCTGFEWGYRGAGSHCLALALLLDALKIDKIDGKLDKVDQQNAMALFEKFARGFCYSWPQSMPWEITDEAIRDWCRRQRDYVPSPALAQADPAAFVTAIVEGGES